MVFNSAAVIAITSNQPCPVVFVQVWLNVPSCVLVLRLVSASAVVQMLAPDELVPRERGGETGSQRRRRSRAARAQAHAGAAEASGVEAGIYVVPDVPLKPPPLWALISMAGPLFALAESCRPKTTTVLVAVAAVPRVNEKSNDPV